MSLPNYMFLGAAKSATTTYYDILKNHNEVFVPKFKEPHFFNFDKNFSKGIDWYSQTYFGNVSGEKAIIDFTPTYLYSNLCAERIFNCLGPKMKFVVILRDPVDRAYSHYNHSVRDGHEEKSFIDAINLEAKRIDKFKKNNDFLSELRCSYISQGMYFNMLNSYLKYYNINDFLIINFDEEVIKNINKTKTKLSDFLNIDLTDLDFNIHSNKSGKSKNKLIQTLINKDNILRKVLKFFVPQMSRQILRNRIKNLNKKEFNYNLISDKKRKIIYDKYFSDDIKKLEEIIGRKMNWNNL